VDDWGKLLGDTAAVTAPLDRLLHHAHVLKCGPRSWRTKVLTDLRTEEANEVELHWSRSRWRIGRFCGVSEWPVFRRPPRNLAARLNVVRVLTCLARSGDYEICQMVRLALDCNGRD
jgi:hypothetical protein